MKAAELVGIGDLHKGLDVKLADPLYVDRMAGLVELMEAMRVNPDNRLACACRQVAHTIRLTP